MVEIDAIIIGAGLAGLTAGAKLSKEGKNVVLIEQHHTPGGCATTFKRKNYEFEVGLHEMDGLGNESDSKQEIFKDLEIFDHIDFIRVPEFYRFLHGKTDFIMPDNLDSAISALCTQFPEEKENINNFFKELQNLRALKMRSLIKRHKQTLGEVLDEFFTDNELKLVICANLAYYHDDAYQLSIIYYAHAQLSYLTGGGWYIKGGSLKLSRYLAEVITNNGGEIILKHEVTQILLDKKKKRAIGIEYKRCKRKDPDIQQKNANLVISNAAVPLITGLIPSLKQSDYEEKINSPSLPCSLFSIYLAFTDHEFENKCYSTFILPEHVNSLQESYINESQGTYDQKGFVFVDYGLLGEKPIGVICGIDYLKNWDHLDQKTYKQKKKEITEHYIGRLNEFIPGIKGKLKWAEMATPKTIVRYTRNPQGVVYGYAQTPDMLGKKRLQKTVPPISNLHFASAWGSGGGYSGAIYSGYKTAQMLLKKKLV